MPLRFFPARLEKRRTYPEFNLFHTVLIEFDNAFAIADDDVEEYLFNFLDRYAKQNGGMFDCFGETLYSYETVEKCSPTSPAVPLSCAAGRARRPPGPSDPVFRPKQSRISTSASSPDFKA